MLLGVLLHASMPYLFVLFPWAVVDGSRSVSLTLLIYTIHSFRMPAFFLIAGFFARLVLQRDGVGAFVKHRLRRILGPLVVGWIVLYPLVRFLWVWSGVRMVQGADLYQAVVAAFTPPFLGRGLGLIHLWFLYYLLLLYGFAVGIRWVGLKVDRQGKQQQRLDALFLRLLHSRLGIFGLAIPTACALLPMRGWGVDFADRSLWPRAAHLLFYGFFFLMGWWLHRHPTLLATLRNRWGMHVAISSVLLFPITGLLYWIYSLHYDAGFAFRIVYFLLYATISWGFVLGWLGAFERFFHRPNAVWRYLADASYWIYLVHLPLVIALAILLRSWPIGWYIKLPLVLASSLPLLLGSYHIFVRYTGIGIVLHGPRIKTNKIN